MTKAPKSSALSVELWPTSKPIPYARNARKIPQSAIDKVAASIQEFGFRQPIVVDKKRVILAGHTRLLAAQKLGLKQVPVHVAANLTVAQAKAYRLADNRTNDEATWDSEMLALELADLKVDEFDLALTGFNADELIDLDEKSEAENAPSVVDHPRTQLLFEKAWAMICEDWRHIGTNSFEYLTPELTRGVAAWHFVNAKYCGGDYPRKLSLAFTPEQFSTAGDDGGSVPDLLAKIATGDTKLIARLRFALKEKPDTKQLFTSSVPMAGHKTPLDFPADLARDLIDSYCPKGGAVLDPCHGWGGRCVGFMLARNPVRYVGCDPSPTVNAGVGRLIETLAPFAEPDKKAIVLETPFEDFISKELFDFAITSPPYFDREKYDGEQSSFRRFRTFESWVGGFYRPLIEKAFRMLKHGSAFALQVGSQVYPLADTAKTITREVGFALERTESQVIRNVIRETDDEHSEAVLIFRKPAMA